MGTARRKPKYRNIIATGNRAEPKYFGDRMDWIRNKFQPGQMVSVQKQMSEEDDTPEDRKAKRKSWVPYRVVKAYRWHLLLQDEKGFLESFTWSDVLQNIRHL